MPTGPDQERREPAQDTPPKPLIAIKTGHETLDRRISGFSRLIERIKAWPSVAHLLRAAERLTIGWAASSAPPSPTFHSSR